MKKRRIVKVLVFGIIAGLLASCSAASKVPAQEIRMDKIVSGSHGPSWVWDPKYYVYDGRNYRFVRGHYRKILFRKSYLRKSVEGYTNKRKRGANGAS